MEKLNITPLEILYQSPTWTNSVKNISSSGVSYARNNKIKTLIALGFIYGGYRSYGFYKMLREMFGFGGSSKPNRNSSDD